MRVHSDGLSGRFYLRGADSILDLTNLLRGAILPGIFGVGIGGDAVKYPMHSQGH